MLFEWHFAVVARKTVKKKEVSFLPLMKHLFTLTNWILFFKAQFMPLMESALPTQCKVFSVISNFWIRCIHSTRGKVSEQHHLKPADRTGSEPTWQTEALWRSCCHNNDTEGTNRLCALSSRTESYLEEDWKQCERDDAQLFSSGCLKVTLKLLVTHAGN